jgi:hypothetical protein
MDLDSDGIDEFIVTNGRVGDDFGANSPSYEQPVHRFRRKDEGTYAIVNDDGWGDYFRTPHVGRSLLTADVNRDGRADAEFTHTRESIALLINEFPTSNHRIGFQLIATGCSRDAIGAIVRFEVAGQRSSLWTLSRDGSLSSSDKTLLAGLGDICQVHHVEVTWQDGRTTHFGTLQANRQYLLVQNETDAFTLADY